MARCLLLLLFMAGCAPSISQQVHDFNQHGVSLLGQQDYLGARQQFQMALQLDDMHPITWYNLGIANHQLGDLQQAEQCYHRCLQQIPDHPECRHSLTLLLLQQNRDREAWNLVEEWLQRQPNSAYAYAEKGFLLRESGDFPAALAQLQHALALEASNPRALMEMALLYETYNYPDRARSLYQRILMRNPQNIEVIRRLSTVPGTSTPNLPTR